jgi:hypothetical protein
LFIAGQKATQKSKHAKAAENVRKKVAALLGVAKMR